MNNTFLVNTKIKDENNVITELSETIIIQPFLVTTNKKEIWFQFVCDNKKYWANGFTLKRLEKVKQYVFDDESIMWDLLVRHGKDLTPQQMKESDVDNFNHCIGNFYCNIFNKMIQTGIYKIK